MDAAAQSDARRFAFPRELVRAIDRVGRRDATQHPRCVFRIVSRTAIAACGVVPRASGVESAPLGTSSVTTRAHPRGKHPRRADTVARIARRAMPCDPVRACVIDARSTRARRRVKSRMSCERPSSAKFKNFLNCQSPHTMTRGSEPLAAALETLGALASASDGRVGARSTRGRRERVARDALRDVSNDDDEALAMKMMMRSKSAPSADAEATPDVGRDRAVRERRGRARAAAVVTPKTVSPPNASKSTKRKFFKRDVVDDDDDGDDVDKGASMRADVPSVMMPVMCTPVSRAESETVRAMAEAKRLDAAFAKAAAPSASRPRLTDDDHAMGDSVAAAFAATISPMPKVRAPRRWLAAEEKTFVCGIDGCAKRYGSAPSLCAHKRARHPGWKAQKSSENGGRWSHRRKAATTQQNDDADGDDADGNAEDGGDDGDDDAAVRMSRQRGASGIDDDARGTALGAYMEIVAADAHGRMGQANRAKRRLTRAARDVRVALAGSGMSSPERAAAASAARIYTAMEDALDAEQERTSAWLDTLDVVSHVVGRTKSLTADAEAPEETRRACAVARVARDMLRAIGVHNL